MLAKNQVLHDERYRIIDCIEQNATGALYNAFDNNLDKNVVLKEIPVKLKKVVTVSQQEEIKIAFAREAKVLTELTHDSLLRVYDYFSGIDRHYLVMESFDGANLSALLEKKKTALPLSNVMNWAEQMLDALNYLHKQMPPTVHCGVNPQIVKLTSDGKIKLLAFDIAKKSGAKENSTVGNQNFDDKILNYLPLEQIFDKLDLASQKVITNTYDEKSEMILKQPADARSDIYALGATLYHLLTARVPIDALERSIDILEGKADPLLSPNKLNPNVPREISDVLMKALELKRENRFDSAVIMRQILRTAFVRMKEREAKESEKQDQEIVLEFPRAQTESLEKKQELVRQQKLKVEAGQKHHAELIKKQLLESENQRQKAEQCAAEAENLLLEQETKAAVKTESARITEKSAEDLLPTEISADPSKKVAETADSDDEFKDLFAQPQKNNRVWRQMSAAALVLLLLGGAVFGIIKFRFFEKTQSNSSAQDQITTFAETVIPETTVEAAPMPTAEPTAEINAPVPVAAATPELKTPETETVTETVSETVAAPNLPKTQLNRFPPKYKTVSPNPSVPKIEKPVAPPAVKPLPKKPKAVTVDDIISGN